MADSLRIGSTVQRYYADDWFDQGVVIAIADEIVEVDMIDWIQGWRVADLQATLVFFKLVFVSSAPGWLIRSFGQGTLPL